MNVLSKILVSKTHTPNSVLVDGYWLSKKEMFSKEDNIEIVERLSTLTFLNRKDIVWRKEHLSHLFDHDNIKISKILYILTQIRSQKGQPIFKLVDDYGFAAVKLIGSFDDYIKTGGEESNQVKDEQTSEKLETVKTDEPPVAEEKKEPKEETQDLGNMEEKTETVITETETLVIDGSPIEGLNAELTKTVDVLETKVEETTTVVEENKVEEPITTTETVVENKVVEPKKPAASKKTKDKKPNE